MSCQSGKRGRPFRQTPNRKGCERRMRAADLFEQGVIPAEVGRQLGVSHQIVSDWRAPLRQSRRDGRRDPGRAGRLPKLGRHQLAHVELQLINGAEANGYPD